MKRLFLIILLIPVLTMAQQKAKPVAKTKTVKTTETKVADVFSIDADIKGFPDGTPVSLLNGQTGAPESETTIKQNKFRFNGKLQTPDFKIILFNKKPPYLTLFLDNSKVKIVGENATVDRSLVTGSVSHNEFQTLLSQLAPYQNLFGENPPNDPAAKASVQQLTEAFIKNNPSSYIAPLAAIRYFQVSDNIENTERVYNLLSPAVKQSSMSNYVAQQIVEGKRNAIGSILPDFSQPDTTGKLVSLSSLRGKYVLIDFWASWCRPCRQENPNVVENYNKFKDKNFTVLGVSLDKSKPAWVEAINMDGLTWPHISDLQGWGNSVAQQFQIQSIPQNFLVGPDGKIIAKNLRGPSLEHKLEQLLK